MVFLVGGYLLNYEDATEWGKRFGVKLNDPILVPFYIDKHFQDHNLPLRCIPVDWPGTRDPKVLFVTHSKDDPRETIDSHHSFDEDGRAHDVRRRLFESNGYASLKNVEFATVVDPYGEEGEPEVINEFDLNLGF